MSDEIRLNEEYKRVTTPDDTRLEPCPVCGADAELWSHSLDFKNGPIHKVVMCSNGEKFGPQIADGGCLHGGCLLFMPSNDFYRNRIVDAVKYWNDYAKALDALRRKNRWKQHSAMREAKVVEDCGRKE